MSRIVQMETGQLPVSSAVVQALDNQWVPKTLLRRLAARQSRTELFARSATSDAIELLADRADVAAAEASAGNGAGVWYEDPYILLVRDPSAFRAARSARTSASCLHTAARPRGS